MAVTHTTAIPSDAARQRLLAVPGEPLFLAEWDQAVFIHYGADPAILQTRVPFELDVRDGRAFVSVVAFTMRRMRPRIGGRLGEWLCKPIATHGLLNVRTYVRHGRESGIYFMAEWLSNRLSLRLGPLTYGLPYRLAQLAYDHGIPGLRGDIASNEGRFSYRSTSQSIDLEVCEAESLTEFLLERYTAFTRRKSHRCLFRIWHKPWPKTRIDISIIADDLLASTGEWWQSARYIGATYSPGVSVWMGWPHRIRA